MAITNDNTDLARYREGLELIVEDPAVQGGAATFRRTRLLVQHVADLIAQGVSEQGLAGDYPQLTGPMLEAVVIYAKAHPHRGRPQQPSWRNTPPVGEATHQTGEG
jgi:uncharacterized protein (DUF433 family)